MEWWQFENVGRKQSESSSLRFQVLRGFTVVRERLYMTVLEGYVVPAGPLKVFFPLIF